MTTTALLLLLLGLAVGAVVGALAASTRSATTTAALRVERDLLRERVTDLEAANEQDHELMATLGPLTATVGRMEQQVGLLERDRVEQYARLDQQLTQVHLGGEALRATTTALAGALRSSSARGAWGEVQLRRVVELAGMLPRVDFSTQLTGLTTSGEPVRPDLVVHLPQGKNVVVDAKAPLAALLEAAAGADPAASAAAHARALRGHVEALAAKEYWTAFQPSPEVVICFVPSEAVLAAACEADATLLEHAMARRVVLATPTTLLTLLRTVALTWQTEALTGNAQELFELGRELHTRLGTLGESAGKLGRTLHRAVEDYNALVGTLERRVLVTARRMSALDLTDGTVAPVEPIESTPRPLTAVELLDGREAS